MAQNSPAALINTFSRPAHKSAPVGSAVFSALGASFPNIQQQTPRIESMDSCIGRTMITNVATKLQAMLMNTQNEK